MTPEPLKVALRGLFLSRPKNRMKVLRKIRPIVFIIIPALLWIGYNNAANWHLHKMQYGIVVTHAHSYDKSADDGQPVKNHKHNKWQIVYLNQIFYSFLVCLSLLIISILLRSSFSILKPQPIRIYNSKSQHYLITVRGPPSDLF